MLTSAFLSTVVLCALLVLIPRRASAHCDTENGPAVTDGRNALKTGNINHALKWIPAESEAELRTIFNKAVKVRTLGGDAAEVADRYFLENLVRIHRAGEGASYEGIKPAGTAVDPKVVAADEAMRDRRFEVVACPDPLGPTFRAAAPLRQGQSPAGVRRERPDGGPRVHRSLCVLL